MAKGSVLWEIFTVSCFEDNSFVKKSVELDGYRQNHGNRW
ncbi:MAG: hypothetical protein CM15mP93_11070 [Thiotrichaceae bacterium]|nr:MAG: hypothetical protein CM15mP93_11070 [Thiotrichaceae bacterium]